MLRVDDVVKVVPGYALGTIESIGRNVTNERDIYLIRLEETKELIKCTRENLILVEKETPGRKTITITEREFTDVLERVVSPLRLAEKHKESQTTTTILSLSGVIIGQDLREELFGYND